MRKNTCCLSALLALSVCCTFALGGEADPYLGRWALTIPGGGAGWLRVEQQDGYLDASILWGGGSVVGVDWVGVVDGALYALRLRKVERKNAAGEVIVTQMLPETILAHATGDALQLTQMVPHRNGLGVDTREFTGQRIPPLPAAPDLSKAEYGKPIELFNGKDLAGWKLTNPNAKSAWSAADGVLVNDPVQEKGKPRVHYGNLRTVAEFEDFNLKLEVNVPRGGNSGIYLRGIYEVQVADTYGRRLDSHNMGGVYSRITPTVAAEKPAGQWQTVNITLMDRHVTVQLNDQRIIDNQPLLGCTGGALWSDEFRPGPIYLQGDHTGVSYRNIVLTPILN
ncbi:MAG: DUF1080 domain-containing protein [Phycisphaerales bacterium]|nr:MAG: DUF1080 domain-containing protein [Phycisphaerales bacterium]